ncbi:LysR family transcriptional regulator [Lysinibacillus telephonicus]|uniref:LysR family transcriptional regulator n=1 Tax=Lysinibacillus telephonicus TaxID=1714840 RepID=UPI0031FC49F0
MNLQQLKVFVCTVQSGKLSIVAKQLNIKQPTVTFHLKALQEHVGVALFEDHSGKQWILTDAGKDFYHYAQQIVSLVHESEQVMEQYRLNKRGKLQLGASETTASYILPPYLAQFQKEHNQVYISLIVNKAPIILEKVKNFELDFGVIAYGDLYDPDLMIVPIMEDELVLIMSNDHPLCKKENVAPYELTRYPFILHEKKAVSHQLAEQWMYQNKVDLNIIMEIGSIQTIKEAVELNIGIAILPKLSVEKEMREGRLFVKPLPNYVNERHIYLIYRKNQHFTPMMKVFIEYLKTSFKAM